MPCILAQKCLTISDKRIYKDVRLTCIDRACEGTCDAREKGTDETEDGSQEVSHKRTLAKFLERILLLDDPVQDIESEQRDCHLKHDQRHRHRPELVVERREIEP